MTRSFGIGYLMVRVRHGAVEVIHEAHGRLSTVLLFTLVVWVTLDLDRRAILPLSVAIEVVVASSTLRYMATGWQQFKGNKTG